MSSIVIWRCSRDCPHTSSTTGSQCTYQLGQKEKRQRVLISSVYESRMQHISNKIDDLSEMMRQLSHERSSNCGLPTSAGLQSPLDSSLRSSESPVASSDTKTDARNHHQPLAEDGGIESTLFAHVIFATRFLQTVVANDPYSNVAACGARSTFRSNRMRCWKVHIHSRRHFLQVLASGICLCPPWTESWHA